MRQSWAPHGMEGYYLGPAMRHYRCFTTYITSTRAICISDSVIFLHTSKQPTLSPWNILLDSEEIIVTAHHNNTPQKYVLSQLQALQQLPSLFQCAALPPKGVMQNTDQFERVRQHNPRTPI